MRKGRHEIQKHCMHTLAGLSAALLPPAKAMAATAPGPKCDSSQEKEEWKDIVRSTVRGVKPEVRSRIVAGMLQADGLQLTTAEVQAQERLCAPELCLSGRGLAPADKKKLLIEMVRRSVLDGAAQADLMKRMVEHVPQRKLMGDSIKGWLSDGSVAFEHKPEGMEVVEEPGIE